VTRIGEIERTREWEPIEDPVSVPVPVEPSPASLPEREPVGIPG